MRRHHLARLVTVKKLDQRPIHAKSRMHAMLMAAGAATLRACRIVGLGEIVCTKNALPWIPVVQASKRSADSAPPARTVMDGIGVAVIQVFWILTFPGTGAGIREGRCLSLH